MSTMSIRLPDSIHKATKALSKKEHISVNQFITLALAEKLAALGTQDFIEKRSVRANKNDFLHVLRSAPDIEPDSDDTL